MESLIKNMDVLIKEWGSFRRRFPSTFPLTMIDVLRRKDHWIRHTFGTCNFSLILRGRGEYRHLDRTWAVEAPCVITQWPGEPVEYGPLAPESTWDELFLMYNARLFPAFKKQHLVDPAQPVWPIRSMSAVEARISELLSVTASPAPAQVVDCVDRLCELLILETQLQPANSVDISGNALTIWQLERELSGNLDQQIEIDELAMRYGMSPATFRRRWSEVISDPPARYRLRVRLREACRLLTQTSLPIYEVAHAVGFCDELYFSRRFNQELKVSPRTYRKMHQVPHATK